MIVADIPHCFRLVLSDRRTPVTDAPRGADGRLRLLAVHAHPDDEASKGAATMARYVAEGVEVLVVTCTGGERGDVLNPQFAPPDGMEFDTLAGRRAVRKLEMATAARALGIEQVFLGFTDSGLPEGDPRPPLPDDAFALVPLEQAAAPLVEAIRRFRPHVVTTYDPSGGYPHPDHIYCHSVSMEAWAAAGDADRFVIPGGAPAWNPLKIYYNHGMSMARLRVVHEALEARGLESPFGDWIASRMAREIPERPVTARLVVADYFTKRDQALIAHASQIDPTGFFFAVPRDLEAEVWPWEDFELAESRVPVADHEDDLFAGIRDTPLAR
jgi:mycothiol S-conjugate amidase